LAAEKVERPEGKKSLWEMVSDLYPRPNDKTGVKPWVVGGDEEEEEEEVDEEGDKELQRRVDGAVQAVPYLSDRDKQRLKLIVRYNALSVETNGEQLCYRQHYQEHTRLGYRLG
jgi:hypothetical protein